MPPDFTRTDHRIEQVVDFNCSKPAPMIYMSAFYTKAQQRGFCACLICGDLVEYTNAVLTKCCKRASHAHCTAKLKIKNVSFHCEDITSHLVPVVLGQNEVRKREGLYPALDPARFGCLVCGGPVAEWWSQGRGRRENWFDLDITRCRHHNDADRPCKFAVHKECWEVHCELTPSTMAPCCSDIKHQFRPAVIKSMTRAKGASDRNELLNDLRKTGRLRAVGWSIRGS